MVASKINKMATL